MALNVCGTCYLAVTVPVRPPAPAGRAVAEPAAIYAPTVHGPVDGLGLPAISEQSAVIVPLHKELRFVPEPINLEPVCGIPLPLRLSDVL